MIRNVTKKQVLHERPVWARNIFQLGTGLMFRTPRDECLVLPRNPARADIITMWFVFGPLDVLAIDREGKVLACVQLQPWSMWKAPPAAAIIELPAGTIERTHTVQGDTLALQERQGSVWHWYHYALFLGVQLLMGLLLAAVLLWILVTIVK